MSALYGLSVGAWHLFLGIGPLISTIAYCILSFVLGWVLRGESER
jgi:hypothetical protein